MCDSFVTFFPEKKKMEELVIPKGALRPEESTPSRSLGDFISTTRFDEFRNTSYGYSETFPRT